MNPQHISRMVGAEVLIIGDIMLDQYQKGVVERISPEAPVPIVKITEELCRIGGAGNVAQNIASLGGTATLLSVCGQDQNGDKLEELGAAMNIKSRLIRSADRETILKTRIMAAHQQILRVDRESAHPLNQDELQRLIRLVEKNLPEFSTIILSDYGKGVISAPFLTWLAQNKKSGQKIILDPKTRNFPHYYGLSCMTPNTKEASEGAGMPIADQKGVILAGKRLLGQCGLDSLVITLGADGMAVFLPGQGVYHLPTMARTVFDVTGAGDTVIAVIALGMSAGLSLLDAAIVANCAAGLVVAQVGTVGVTQKELSEAFGTWGGITPEKWCEL